VVRAGPLSSSFGSSTLTTTFCCAEVGQDNLRWAIGRHELQIAHTAAGDSDEAKSSPACKSPARPAGSPSPNVTLRRNVQRGFDGFPGIAGGTIAVYSVALLSFNDTSTRCVAAVRSTVLLTSPALLRLNALLLVTCGTLI